MYWKNKTNYGLELYNLIMECNSFGFSYVDDFGWISTGEFCVWVSYFMLNDFMNDLKYIFGNGMFDDGGFDANMQEDGVCIDLREALGNYLDIEEVFPKEKYQH